MRAAFGTASAEAVRSCFIQSATPTPVRTAITTAIIVRCGHTFRLFISAPSSCFHGSFGKDHACDKDLPGTLLPITQSSSDRNERATFLPLINTDLHYPHLSVASVAELVTHIVRSLNEIVSLNLRKHR